MSPMINSHYQSELYKELGYTSPGVLSEALHEHEYLINGKDNFIAGKFLNWDTEVLGIRCARIEQIESSSSIELPHNIMSYLALLEADGIRFCDCRVGLHALNIIQVLEQAGFFLTDLLNIYVCDFRTLDIPVIRSEYQVAFDEEISGENLVRALEIAKGAFTYSRFYHDPQISLTAAEDFYEELSRGFLTSKKMLTVQAMDSKGYLVGFVTGSSQKYKSQSKEYGYLSLIAIAGEHTGKGIGRLLLSAFLKKMKRNCSHVEIGTQISNKFANKLYRSFSLQPVCHLATLHKWLA